MPTQNNASEQKSGKIQFRLIPITMGLAILVLIIKIFHIPTHIQAWRHQSGHELPEAHAISEPLAQQASRPIASQAQARHFQHVQKTHTMNEEEMKVLINLNKEREHMIEQEKSFKKKEITLKAIQDRISEKVSSLENNKNTHNQDSQKSNEFHEKTMDTLVKTYEGMKPKIAAQLLQEMDARFVMLIVSKLKPAKLTAILTAMDPEAARQLSRKLAEQGFDSKAVKPQA